MGPQPHKEYRHIAVKITDFKHLYLHIIRKSALGKEFMKR